MIATMTTEAATDREIFPAYLEELLCIQLKTGDVVVMDGLRSHNVKGVQRRIEKCGATLLYLPPYAPDLKPNERKRGPDSGNGIRSTRMRSNEALNQACAQLLPLSCKEDAKAWLRLPFAALLQ
jgi:hypothetical protein